MPRRPPARRRNSRTPASAESGQRWTDRQASNRTFAGAVSRRDWTVRDGSPLSNRATSRSPAPSGTPDVERIVGCRLKRVGSYQEAVSRRQPVSEAAGPERQRASALSPPALRQADAAEREGEAAVTLHRDPVCRDRRVE